MQSSSAQRGRARLNIPAQD